MADDSVTNINPAVEFYDLPLNSSPDETKKLAETLLKLAPQSKDFMRIVRDGIRPGNQEDAKLAKIAAFVVLSALSAFTPESSPS